MSERLSATVVAKDEEDRLPATLATLGFADEVVVVVDASTRDGTARVAESAGARVCRRTFDGAGAETRFAASRCRGPWILSVNPEERVSPDLAREIGEVLAREDAAGPAAYRVPIRLQFLGRILFRGRDTFARPIRLYRRDRARFDAVRGHERLRVEGDVGSLSSPIVRSYRDLTHYLETVDRLTTLAAEAKQTSDRLSLRLATGGSRRLLLLRFLWELLDRVLLRGAFRDGREGLAYAALSACSTLIKYLKVSELTARAVTSKR